MDKKVEEKIDEYIKDAIGEVDLGGVKGKVLHEHIRSVLTTLRLKWIQQGETNVENHMAALEKDLEEHLVIEAEKEVLKEIKIIVKELARIYLVFYAFMLYQREDLKELKTSIEDIAKKMEGKLSPDRVKELRKIFTDLAEEWEDELTKFRDQLNSIWATAKGNAGFALALFEKTHKQGFFLRYQERKKFKDALRKTNLVDDHFDALEKVKSTETLKELLGNIETDEETAVEDFELLDKMLGSTWDTVNKEFQQLAKMIHKAVYDRELPQEDEKFMVDVREAIVRKLNKQYLHALQIDEQQLLDYVGNIKAAAAKIK